MFYCLVVACLVLPVPLLRLRSCPVVLFAAVVVAAAFVVFAAAAFFVFAAVAVVSSVVAVVLAAAAVVCFATSLHSSISLSESTFIVSM